MLRQALDEQWHANSSAKLFRRSVLVKAMKERQSILSPLLMQSQEEPLYPDSLPELPITCALYFLPYELESYFTVSIRQLLYNELSLRQIYRQFRYFRNDSITKNLRSKSIQIRPFITMSDKCKNL